MQFSKHNISLFLAILFHLTGLIGILYTPYKDWFIKQTPFNLCLMAALLIWNQPSKNRSFFIFFATAFLTGMGTEMIGVQTGRLFGNYQYGNLLGPKLYGVPWLIGLNWFVVVFCSGSVIMQVQQWFRRKFEKKGSEMPTRVVAMSLIIDGALLAVFVGKTVFLKSIVHQNLSQFSLALLRFLLKGVFVSLNQSNMLIENDKKQDPGMVKPIIL